MKRSLIVLVFRLFRIVGGKVHVTLKTWMCLH